MLAACSICASHKCIMLHKSTSNNKRHKNRCKANTNFLQHSFATTQQPLNGQNSYIKGR